MKYRDENGDFQDLYFKTGDTLPIGTEVDYDGETAPVGWEEIDNPEEYSTDEVKTNKVWIDGKPIYRKVIDFGELPDTTGKTVDTNISDLATVIDLRGIALTKTTFLNAFPLPYVDKFSANNDNIELTWLGTNHQIRINTSNDRTGLVAYIVVEYTKTTD